MLRRNGVQQVPRRRQALRGVVLVRASQQLIEDAGGLGIEGVGAQLAGKPGYRLVETPGRGELSWRSERPMVGRTASSCCCD
jgi:hypothetical protein